MTMKKITLKLLFIYLTLILMVSHVSAQDLVGTRIDVQGAQFSDQMWLFTVATCTYNFDNGWDGYKIFGASVAPQIFAIEPDGYYQVSSVPDVNNTYLGFSAGVDTAYTFTFTHENLAENYQQLFLIDSVANKTIDIYQTGTTYKFSAQTTPLPVRRFKIVTSLPPVVVIPTVPKDTVPVVSPINPKNPKDKDKKHHPKKIKIYNSGENIYIENPGKQKGKIKICHAVTGRVLKIADFNGDGTTIINARVPKGTYVVNGVTPLEDFSITIIIR